MDKVNQNIIYYAYLDLSIIMSITKRYIIFDEIEKEETMALFQENLAYNFLIQDTKSPNWSLLIEQNNNEIDEKTITVSKELLAVPEIAQAIKLAEQSAYSPGELNGGKAERAKS